MGIWKKKKRLPGTAQIEEKQYGCGLAFRRLPHVYKIWHCILQKALQGADG